MTLLEALTAAASNAEALKTALSRAHEDHDGDLGCAWWRLVRDAYEHRGGFRASIAQPETLQGEASYTATSRGRTRESYLRRFPREHVDTYQRRIDSSTYENHVAPIVDVYGGHLTRRPPQRSSDVRAVSEWWARADAQGVDVQTFVESGLKGAQLFGWRACLFDRPRGEFARGDVAARTVARWLEPEEVRDWQVGLDGSLDWIRLASEREERDPVTGDEVEVYEWTIWTRTEWARVVMRETEGDRYAIETIDGAEHGLGRVPVAVLYWQRSLDADCLFGLSQVNDVVPLNVALFNRRSELTHHLRSAVFALLCLQSDDPEAFASLKIGTNNGIRYATGTNAPSFIAPPADVAETLAKECDRLKTSIYEAAKIERPRADAQGGDVASGVARAYDFAATEAVLMGAVTNLATWEYEAAAIVALWDAAPVADPARVFAETTATTKITYPQSFDAAGLARDLTAALDALDPTRVEQVLPSTRRTARVRIARALSPDATPEELVEIEREATLIFDAERASLQASADLAVPGASTGATTGAAGA
jgi:hypothetical protein